MKNSALKNIFTIAAILSTSVFFAQNYTFKLGVNNFTNTQYFTKRPTGYPGVGVWSSDGRSIVATLQFKI